jgi:hypothetical protein
VRDEDISLYLKGLHGTVGSAATQQFLAFLRHRDKLPDPDLILRGGDYTPPISPDAQYVMLGSLITALLQDPTEERIDHYFRYVNHYSNGPSADYAVVLVKELVLAFENSETKIDGKKLKEFLSEHQGLINWVADNIDVLS